MDRHRRGIMTSPQVLMLFGLFVVTNHVSALTGPNCPPEHLVTSTLVIDEKDVGSVPDFLEQEVSVDQTVRFKVDTPLHFPIKELTFTQHGGLNMTLTHCLGVNHCHGRYIDLTPLRKGQPVEIRITGSILHEDCSYSKLIHFRLKCPTEDLLNPTMVIDDMVFPAILGSLEQEVDVDQLVGFEVHTASHVPIVELSITQHGGVNQGISRCRGGHFCFGGYFDLNPLRKGHPVEVRITGSMLRKECTYQKVISFHARCRTTDSVQCQGTVDGLVVPFTQDDQLQGVFANQNVTVECETSLDTCFAEVNITQRIQGGEEDKEMSHCEGGYYCSGGPVDLRPLCQGHGAVLEVTGRILPGYCGFNKTLTLSAARAMLSDTETADWCREPETPTEATDQGDMMPLETNDNPGLGGGKKRAGAWDAKGSSAATDKVWSLVLTVGVAAFVALV